MPFTRVLKLVLQYDGQQYHGWHDQTNALTVSRVLKKSFKSAFGHDCLLKGSSRTDTGVHALFQVARLDCNLRLSDEQILSIFNVALPSSINIKSLESVDHEFNPLANVLFKEYRYKIFKIKQNPINSAWGWFCPWRNYINWERFEGVLDVFVGSHDFRAFCKIEKGEVKETVRTVDTIKVLHHDKDQIIISIIAQGFLRYQVRRMIGCALEFAKKIYFVRDDIEKALKTNGTLPSQLDYKAPGEGLCLMEIRYNS